MAAAKRAAVAVGSLPTATRGRISERAWVDIRIAARIAREEGATLRLHGVEASPSVLKQHKQKAKAHKQQEPPKPVEAAGRGKPQTTAVESTPAPLSKRKRRSAKRLLDFQEGKRKAAVQEFVSRGIDLSVAQMTVARAERKRLEQIADARVAPMDADAAPIEGLPRGEEGLTHGGSVGSKRAPSPPPPEDGQHASRRKGAPQGGCMQHAHSMQQGSGITSTSSC